MLIGVGKLLKIYIHLYEFSLTPKPKSVSLMCFISLTGFVPKCLINNLKPSSLTPSSGLIFFVKKVIKRLF